MNSEAHHKVQAEHLSRNALLYVRQSTPRQVRENVESTKRQYGLRDQAIALGWATEQIIVIDCDQGQSGSSAVAREGFQKLATEVSMNRAGIVMGLEVSRLARNSSDWHRLPRLVPRDLRKRELYHRLYPRRFVLTCPRPALQCPRLAAVP